ncbi:hypothetical protein SNEBB_001256 [Seison nebaliae]|nr:hypothetical protein SNEBB_001256 [Seison nebaliae]
MMLNNETMEEVRCLLNETIDDVERYLKMEMLMDGKNWKEILEERYEEKVRLMGECEINKLRELLEQIPKIEFLVQLIEELRDGKRMDEFANVILPDEFDDYKGQDLLVKFLHRLFEAMRKFYEKCLDEYGLNERLILKKCGKLESQLLKDQEEIEQLKTNNVMCYAKQEKERIDLINSEKKYRSQLEKEEKKNHDMTVRLVSAQKELKQLQQEYYSKCRILTNTTNEMNQLKTVKEEQDKLLKLRNGEWKSLQLELNKMKAEQMVDETQKERYYLMEKEMKKSNEQLKNVKKELNEIKVTEEEMNNELNKYKKINQIASNQIDGLHRDLKRFNDISQALDRERDANEALHLAINKLEDENNDLRHSLLATEEREGKLLQHSAQLAELNATNRLKLSSLQNGINLQSTTSLTEINEDDNDIQTISKRKISMTNQMCQTDLIEMEDEETKVDEGIINEELQEDIEKLKNELKEKQQNLEEVKDRFTINERLHQAECKDLRKELIQLRNNDLRKRNMINSSSSSLSTSSNTNISNDNQIPVNEIGNGMDVKLQEKVMKKMTFVQKENIRLLEKIDFLNEHVDQLTKEVQKKGRIIKVFSDSTEIGNCSQSHNSLTNKSLPSTDMIIQMKNKLQLLLEDSITNNETLKSNIDTLATELRSTKKENEKLKNLLNCH